MAEILDYSPDTVVDLLGFTLLGESANIRNVNFLSEECNSWPETYFQLLYALATTQPFDHRSIEHLLQSLYCRIVVYARQNSCVALPIKGRKEELFRRFIELLNSYSGKHNLSFYAERMTFHPNISVGW